MTISFRYKTVKRPDDTKVKTPSIPIILDGKEKFETIALIDSGADISKSPGEWRQPRPATAGQKAAGESQPDG